MAVNVEEFIHQIEQEPVFRERLSALIASKQPAIRMTYPEFLEWANEDTLSEWNKGEVSMASPASYRHQELVQFLTSVLGIYAETRHLGVICPAPFQIKLEHSGREPDILFIANGHLDRLKPTYLDGPADVVVEIISLDSAERDRGTKFLEYEAAGIPEYWLLDPLRQWAEFYVLGAEKCYNVAFAGRQGVYRSTTIAGLWLRVEWLWQTPLPLVLDVIREIGLI
jgi:Uma2 family endonuclease